MQLNDSDVVGRYSYEATGYGVGSTVEFNEDKTFIYTWVTGLINGTTEGTWSISGKKIILNSERKKSDTLKFRILENSGNNSDFYSFKFLDENKDILPKVICLLLNDSDKIKSVDANFDGELQLSKAEDFQKLKFIFLGFHEFEIKKEDLLTPDIYSPIRDTYPNGTTLTIAQILEYTVSMSDNVGCDMLLKLLGGPSSVEKYFHEKGFKDISIKINEETMQSDWNSQFQNWTTPLEANKILKAFYENKNAYLSPESHQFIWNILKNTSTGAHRLKGLLPAGTTVAHKTGWSGQNKQTGITAAVNNIGIIFLPNGEPLYISVFVTESIEDFDANERIIAEIAEMAWNYYTKM